MPADRFLYARRVAAYTLTVRNGPVVERERFESLERAVAALRERCDAILAEGGLEGVSMIRDFGPEQLVTKSIQQLIANPGALQVLEENGVYPQVIAGTSVGALIGGALAIGLAFFQFWGDWLQIGLIAGIFWYIGTKFL